MKRILVVDDDEKVCFCLREHLEDEGYQVFTALDGIVAIHLLKEERPHVVLLDIQMPGPNGLTVLQRMKEVDPRTTVIMVTALQDRETANKAVSLGADGYINKPIDLEHLELTIQAKIAMMTA